LAVELLSHSNPVYNAEPIESAFGGAEKNLKGMACYGPVPGALSAEGCAIVFQALQSEVSLYENSLLLAPSEPPSIVFTRIIAGVGSVDAPVCPPANSLSVTCLRKRVKAGHNATFVIAPSAEAGCGDIGVTVLDTLTALVQARVELHHLGDAQGDAIELQAALYSHEKQLPATYELSMTHNGVLIVIAVPFSAPDGARVVIRRVSVRGSDALLDGAPLHVTVGFNHAPAPHGPLHMPAFTGDLSALLCLLDDGASTEGKDISVSGSTRVQYALPPTASGLLSCCNRGFLAANTSAGRLHPSLYSCFRWSRGCSQGASGLRRRRGG
jgi:hypothetical protein